MITMNRYQAALIHLSLSAIVAGAAFATIYFLWFPGALFAAAGGLKLFSLIAGVDVALGPLLTLIVYKPGKPSLRFDLAVIAALQVAGLAYGVHVLAEARPAYIVFVKDRFELARANHIAPEDLAKGAPKGFGTLPMTGPRIVGSRLPDDPDERFRIMSSALAGIDLQGYPQYFVPYEAVREEVLRSAAPIASLRKLNAEDPGSVDRALREAGLPEGELRFLPFRAGLTDLAVLVDARDARVVHIARLKPW